MRIFYCTFIISVVLMVGGFFVPPLGVIDGSVLTAVGELLMFGAIARVPDAIKSGRSVKISKGDFSVDVGNAE